MKFTLSESAVFLTKRVKEKSPEIIKKAVVDLVQDFIDDTPVDTSKLKNNWFVETQKSMQTTEETGETNRAKSLVFKMGDSIFIENNQPYAKRCEFGWSKKKPNGMVRKNIGNFKVYLKRHANASN